MSGAKKAFIKIEPFRNPIKLEANYPEKTWKVLESAIQEIFNKNASGLSFEELYRNAYNMVLHKHGDNLYSGLVRVVTNQLQRVATGVDGKVGESVLRELKSRWEEHVKAMQMIRDILMYMDRTYVMHQKKVAVFNLGLELWRDHVVRNRAIHDKMLNVILDMVAKERSGESIERGLIKSVTQMLVDLSRAGGVQVYEEDFEKHFLASAADFYKKESQSYLSSSDSPSYLQKAERRLEEERERVRSYLDASTAVKIQRVVEVELIHKQMRSLVEMEGSGLVCMLMDERFSDLQRMYSLFKAVEGGLGLIRDTMQHHVKETGRALVSDAEVLKDPVSFVQKLLEERDKYERIITTAFFDDKSFRNALNQAFETFINLNQRAPEFISLFIDDKLRKGMQGLSDADVEALLDKVMALFRYLQEKDVFEKYYKQHLAKRLLSGRSVSDDTERALLVKLKTECGYQFTSKLESMFTDIKTSRDMMNDFKAHLAAQRVDLPVDLSVQVLTTGSWPTQAPSRCCMPRELEDCCQQFTNYYLQAHSGRKLTWQTNMGSADLRAFFAESGKRHELSVSTHQMCILMLFNEADTLSYHEIAQATDIPVVELKRSLQSLACVKGKNVLRKEPMSKDISDTDFFSFNEKFTSKLVRVKVNTVAAHKEGEVEKVETRQRVEEDRKPQVEAAIVRLMKARKVLDHNSIITEVTRQLSARFLPNPAIIKKRIESLIEREFLERDPNDRKVYRYVA